MSLAEVCATCLRCHLVIEVQFLELDFHKLEFFLNNCKKSISHVQHTIFISAGSPFHTLGVVPFFISSIHHYFIFL